MNAVF